MSDTALRLLGAFLMLIVGFIAYALIYWSTYAALRRRYERGKVVGRRGIEPHTFMAAVRFGLLICLPVVGFVIGPAILRQWLA